MRGYTYSRGHLPRSLRTVSSRTQETDILSGCIYRDNSTAVFRPLAAFIVGSTIASYLSSVKFYLTVQQQKGRRCSICNSRTESNLPSRSSFSCLTCKSTCKYASAIELQAMSRSPPALTLFQLCVAIVLFLLIVGGSPSVWFFTINTRCQTNGFTPSKLTLPRIPKCRKCTTFPHSTQIGRLFHGTIFPGIESEANLLRNPFSN